MEIETAARKHLMEHGGVTNLTAERVWKFKAYTSLEGTGYAAVVLYRKGGWLKPGFGSQEYPMLVVDCLSDVSRDVNGEQKKDDGEERAMALYREVDRVMHQVDRETRRWPENDEEGLWVLGSFRGSEPDGAVMSKYGVHLVRVTYDVQVVHSG